jgi:hypothetical protein
MGGLDQDAFGARSEKILPHRAIRRTRPDVDGVRNQFLPVTAFRLQPQ